MNSLGERIKLIRKSNKFTQQQFSEELGISQTHVSKIEKNVENASETLIRFIAYRFSVNIDWIKTGVGNSELEYGSSEIGTINRYYSIRNEYENKFTNLNIDQLWNYVDAQYYFIKCLIADENFSVRYLEHIRKISDFLFIITKSVTITEKTDINDKKIIQSKCENMLLGITEEIKTMINDFCNYNE